MYDNIYQTSALGSAWSSLGNATANLTLSNAGYTTTFNQTSAVAWLWANTTTATSSTTNGSPILELAANYWNGSASASDTWSIGTSLAAGTSGTSTLTLTHSGTTGLAALATNGQIQAGTGMSASTSVPMLTVGGTSTAGVGISSTGYLGLFAAGAGSGFFFYQAAVSVAALTYNNSNATTLQSEHLGANLGLSGYLTTQTTYPAVVLNNAAATNGSFTGTSGTQICAAVAPGAAGLVTFAPTSGTANFVGFQINPTINQTSSASGSYTALQINAVETALLGSSNYLINAMAGSAGTASKFSVSNGGNVVAAGTYTSGSSTGVSAGSFSSITAITTVGGIVTQLTGSSDERLKDSVPYEGGLDEILAISPVRYHWNARGQEHTGLSGDRGYVGFLAQNVQRVIPEAITNTEGPEQYLSFDDRPVVAALVNAVKQLTERIRTLEAR
jgi:hypothetical protein